MSTSSGSVSGQSTTGSADALAACSPPTGPVEVFGSTEDTYAAFEGKWWICGNGHLDGPADAIGIEFDTGSSVPISGSSMTASTTEGGLAYYLVQGLVGPVRGTGVDYQRTYDINAVGQIYVRQNADTFYSCSYQYSPSPRAVELLCSTFGPVLLAAY